MVLAIFDNTVPASIRSRLQLSKKQTQRTFHIFHVKLYVEFFVIQLRVHNVP